MLSKSEIKGAFGLKVKSWQIGIGIVAMVLSTLLVLQFRTEQKISSDLPTRQVNELAKMFNSQKTLIEKYEREINELRNQLKDYDQNKEMLRLRMAAGVIPLTGKGLRIFLSDSNKKLKEYEDPIFYIVHYDQLELLVNELKAAGAEAIAINKHRIGNTSGFSCAGNTILIDTKRIAPPYIIEAIGDPDNLKNALLFPGGFVENQILSFKLQFSVQKMDRIEIPSYTGVSFEYAKPIEEAKQR